MLPEKFHLSLCLSLFAFVSASLSAARADDGYRLWLRYDRITDEPLRQNYTTGLRQIALATPAGTDSATLAAARDELTAGLTGLLGAAPQITIEKQSNIPAAIGDEGYALKYASAGKVVIAARQDVGVLYGAFALLRELQTHQSLDKLDVVNAPKIQHRLLNHWDNRNRTVERGYAGQSLWEWEKLPGDLSPRYRDYARANASLGINGTVLNNVNSNSIFLSPEYLRKTAALANVFRPYGIRVYLSARYNSPVEFGDLKKSDPLDPEVIQWWKAKADEIYALIPDFGGFLVKADSEGQPGPKTYNRTHAEGANLLADAVAPHGGIVIWRAFVYEAVANEDRHKQACDEFVPLDGKFRDNVAVQVKNGPIDFMPREPFHPLFGATPKTPLALELQITQEYNGGSSQLCFLAPLWKECLDSDTFRPKAGATVARIVDGSAHSHQISVISGVANTGTDRNWSGNPLAPANWYAFGRLAWDYSLSPEKIADEWTRRTFTNEPKAVRTIASMLLASREAVVNYSMPLGLHHIMATGHHQGPGPWVSDLRRADWNPVYYHRADETGVGFDRTATGSKALEQYAPEAAKKWADPASCPDQFLLWFHHLSWDYKMRSGKTLWDEICLHYQTGVNTVRSWQKSWDTLAGSIDDGRFEHVRKLLAGQEREARIWRDACTQYFANFSKMPLPAGVEAPAYKLDELRALPAPFAAADK